MGKLPLLSILIFIPQRNKNIAKNRGCLKSHFFANETAPICVSIINYSPMYILMPSSLREYGQTGMPCIVNS